MKNTNELNGIINQIILLLSKEYFFDYYLINFKPIEGIDLSKRNNYVKNTIDLYTKYHTKADINKFLQIGEYLDKIVNFDSLIYFDTKIIYKELYKILYLIDTTINIQKLLNNSDAYPKDFAEIQTDLREVNRLRLHHRKNIIGKLKLTDKSESRLKYWLSTLYVKNRNVTKFFLYLFFISDIEKLRLLRDIDKKTKKMLENLYNWFILQKTTVPQVVKSLAILLYWEQIKFLKTKKNEAEHITEAIIYKLFKEPVNFYEFENEIWIKSSVYFPIFGASKEYNLDENEKNFIKEIFKKEISPNVKIGDDKFNMMFDAFLKHPHTQFLEKYPEELFLINPKYSS